MSCNSNSAYPENLAYLLLSSSSSDFSRETHGSSSDLMMTRSFLYSRFQLPITPPFWRMSGKNIPFVVKSLFWYSFSATSERSLYPRKYSSNPQRNLILVWYKPYFFLARMISCASTLLILIRIPTSSGYPLKKFIFASFIFVSEKFDPRT